MYILYVMDLRGDEERHIGRALRHCKHLGHTLRLSLVQVILLNRKYCTSTLASPPATAVAAAVIAAIPSAAPASIARPYCSELQLRTGRNVADPIALRLTASVPEFRQHTSRVYRPLSAIQSQSNDVHVQLIKIRRQIEGVLLRVELLRRTYGKRNAVVGDAPSMAARPAVAGPANRRWSAAHRTMPPPTTATVRRLSEPAAAVNCHSCRTGGPLTHR